MYNLDKMFNVKGINHQETMKIILRNSLPDENRDEMNKLFPQTDLCWDLNYVFSKLGPSIPQNEWSVYYKEEMDALAMRPHEPPMKFIKRAMKVFARWAFYDPRIDYKVSPAYYPSKLIIEGIMKGGDKETYEYLVNETKRKGIEMLINMPWMLLVELIEERQESIEYFNLSSSKANDDFKHQLSSKKRMDHYNKGADVCEQSANDDNFGDCDSADESDWRGNSSYGGSDRDQASSLGSRDRSQSSGFTVSKRNSAHEHKSFSVNVGDRESGRGAEALRGSRGGADTSRPRPFKEHSDKSHLSTITPKLNAKTIKEKFDGNHCIKCGKDRHKNVKHCKAANITCKRCGRLGHLDYLCMTNHQCSKCGGYNHIKEVCRAPIPTSDERVGATSSRRGRPVRGGDRKAPRAHMVQKVSSDDADSGLSITDQSSTSSSERSSSSRYK
jgi:hypothetical protein